MASKWFDKKEEAIKLRKRGLSINYIGGKLGIPKSTLSGWFRNILLTKKQKDRLLEQWRNGLIKARKKASQWHRDEKEKRLIRAKNEAVQVLNNLDIRNKYILDLALAMLYMGEGFKGNDETGIGNSDPLILKTFLCILKKNYNINITKIRCELHLRVDQNPRKMTKFWAQALNLPLENFKYVYFDKRTKGSKTFSYYKGVCMLRCANVAIQRKLLNISRGFCEKVTAE